MNIYLVDVISPQTNQREAYYRMQELTNLVQTLWGTVILETYQKRMKPHYKHFLWSGKIDEIKHDMQRLGGDVVIIGNILKPRQLYELNEIMREINVKVRDRVDLILKIFDKHAHSTEAKLQIELASIKHMWPRIFGMGMELSRQWWWIGTKGIGETNTELMKRYLKDRTESIKKKLTEYASMRQMQRQQRKRKQLPVIGIVWYTNAGKSTLLNAMTNKGVLAEDKLFATLGTSTGKIYVMTDPVMGTGQEILLTDTIWFIRDLPPQLIQAFRSTLEDSIESDLLLHVIDSSDPDIHNKIDIVHNILDEIGADQQRVLVFNKTDMIDEQTLHHIIQQYQHEDTICISAQTGAGLETLPQLLLSHLTWPQRDNIDNSDTSETTEQTTAHH